MTRRSAPEPAPGPADDAAPALWELVIDDGAAYVDAATIAVRFASPELGPVPQPRSSKPGTQVTPEELRATMGRLATGVCVVTTVVDGEDVAMTANSVTSVSLDPPLVLVCVARTARFHSAITASRHWGLSILGGDSVDASTHFSRSGRPPNRQLEAVAHHRGEVTGVALIDGSCAYLECRTEAVHPAGDHSVVIGRVLVTARGPDPVHPLLFHRGSYRWLREDDAQDS